MRKDADSHADEDKKKRALAEARNEGESRAYQLEKLIKQQGDKLKQGQRIPGHTEILESLLGKYKQIQGRHTQGGMTGSLLNTGAVVLKKNPEVIQRALATTSVQMVHDWVRDNLGQTVASRRMLALP